MKLVLQISLVTGVRNQFEYVKKGFNQVFSLEKLKIFYPNEVFIFLLKMLLVTEN